MNADQMMSMMKSDPKLMDEMMSKMMADPEMHSKMEGMMSGEQDSAEEDMKMKEPMDAEMRQKSAVEFFKKSKE